MHILFITDYLPYPPISGDLLRVYNLVRRIAVQNQLTLLVLFPNSGTDSGISHMLEFCERIEMIDHLWPDPLTLLPDLIKYFLKGYPIELRLLYSQKMVDVITGLTGENFDVIQIENSRLALYIEAIPPGNGQTFLTFHNITFDQFQRIAKIERKPLERLRTWLNSQMMQRWEPRYAGRFDRCITVSEADRQILLKANPRLQIDVIPNGVDTRKYHPLEPNIGAQSLLFIGSMNYSPCVDAAIFFCKQVLPLIQDQISQVQTWIVGANPLPEVKALATENIHVTGFVEDVLPYYQQAAVCVVPLRAGGGTRLKILEAMALGRPVISTTIGCEGLDVVDGQHLLIADDPRRLAEETLRLLGDRDLYSLITANARRLVVEKYDWDVIAGQQMSLYRSTQNDAFPAAGEEVVGL